MDALNVTEAEKEEANRLEDAASRFNIYRCRLASDDGFRFILARNKREAAVFFGVPIDKVAPANPDQKFRLLARMMYDAGMVV